jgi:hypothetical protein
MPQFDTHFGNYPIFTFPVIEPNGLRLPSPKLVFVTYHSGYAFFGHHRFGNPFPNISPAMAE